MDEQEAIYQKICQFVHTSYQPGERGDKSREIDETVREVLEEQYDGEFEHAEDRCRECQIEMKILERHDRLKRGWSE